VKFENCVAVDNWLECPLCGNKFKAGDMGWCAKCSRDICEECMDGEFCYECNAAED